MLNESIQKKVTLFADNYEELKKNFMWEAGIMLRLSALIYTNNGLHVDIKEIKSGKEIIKKNTGIFSSFKETAFFALATLLSLEEKQEELFHKTLKVYDELKQEGFHSSVYLALASFVVAKQIDDFNTPAVVHKAKELYGAMKKEHRFLTTADDYGYAALLATTNLSVDQATIEMENCYELLKKQFPTGNSLQSLTHVLTIGEEAATIKCERAIEIYQSLLHKGCKLSKYNGLETLGILVLITEDVEKITEEIANVFQILKEKKGFGIWSITNHERTMYATALVTGEYVEKIQNNTLNITLASSVTSILIAQHVAMVAAASSAAAASSGANN